MRFLDKLLAAQRRNSSLVCVGLDPDPRLLPEGITPDAEGFYTFGREIVAATSDLACAFKPNLAFYEALGIDGLRALERTLKEIPSNVPVIADAKRGDIGNTSAAYATALFDVMGFDAATLNPYLGHDSLEPFLHYPDKGAFILCHTSNPGSADFQELLLSDGTPLYEAVARKVVEWNANGNCALVVGATMPEQLKRVRAIAPSLPILIPGVGAQSGDLRAAVLNGVNAAGERAVINSSRGILYASRGPDFAAAARAATQNLRVAINRVLDERWQGGSLT